MFFYVFFFLREEMHKNHIQNLSLSSLSFGLSSCYCISGAEAFMGGLIWITLCQIVIILSLWPAWLTHIFLPHHSVCCHLASSLCLTSAPRCICFIAFFLSSASLFTYRPCALRPPPSLPPDLHYPPPAPHLPPPLLSSPLSNQICNGAHFPKKKKIFPLHSNAPPHYCSLCCHWCGRRGRDVKLHQRRLHIASAHFSCCQPWPGNNSFSPHTLCLPSRLLSFIFFFVSCLSVHFSVPLQNYKKKKREKRNE